MGKNDWLKINDVKNKTYKKISGKKFPRDKIHDLQTSQDAFLPHNLAETLNIMNQGVK